MASPPYNHNYGNAISPPYPANTQLPPQPKRRSSDMPTSAPSIKRRKTSMMSTTSASSVLHPLRQTSFPPEIAPAYARSPSVDTASLVSGSGTGGTSKKKRASGKKKTKKEREAEDTASLLGGTAPSALSGTGKTKGKRRASDVGQELEEEDEEDDENAVTSGATEAEKAQERENRSLLIRQLDSAQFERYEAWRLSRLPDAQMRRLMNQTLSQSVPAQVILAMRAITKMFAGDLIEGARKVQAQFIEVGEDQVPRRALPSPPTEGDEPKEAETRRGPLTPDHIRESLRRYKVGREGGSVGFLGVWQQQQSSGVERFGIKTGGKRLFK